MKNMKPAYQARTPVVLNEQSGFVLPYVLAVIAIVSILSVVGANALKRAQDNLSTVSQRTELAAALNTAETVATHVFLTSPMVEPGLDLSGQSIDEGSLLMGEPVPIDGLSENDIWNAVGGMRAIKSGSIDVTIKYQDADGLLSLNAADASVLTQWLGPLIEGAQNRQSLIAKLLDYRDANTNRRYQGAERAEYRLARRSPPTNSPLRSYQELQNVMGFDALTVDPDELTTLTLFPTAVFPRTKGMPQALASRLVRPGSATAADDLVGTQLVDSRFPSVRAQFTFTAYRQGVPFGLRRVVEIERTSGNADRAFSRRRIAEYAVNADAEFPEQNYVYLQLRPSAPTRPDE
ncbi:type II secretion system protein GspK [Hyphomonas sp. FCG-A18]|uniref:hypothetical protein n=1 Tax=Hyphomonas sp. FCG-A18 TaxID=3080019 RepID=UPI002B2DFD14|nr:type II secretion system protein GspK [Hyphomonas sp. FCG-A18]